ncbi:hypothetical protein GF362_06200 [Candidatus Dojkabacteria bacterium]|nr:hypothetical protein [Candidatus Dojkabacteria bacterium]
METEKIIPGTNLTADQTRRRLRDLSPVKNTGRHHGEVYADIMNHLITPEMGDLVVNCWQSPCGRDTPQNVLPQIPSRGPILLSNAFGTPMTPEQALQEAQITKRKLGQMGLEIDFLVQCPKLGCDACWLRDRH